jgi:hypothetical protein
MKNLIKKIIKEQIDNIYTYENMYELIVHYITETLKSNKQINEYVPNEYIAKVFRDLLAYLEMENQYPLEFNEKNILILKVLQSGNYFNEGLLRKNKEEEIHRVYQKLRGSKDEIRNTLILGDIQLKNIVMPHKEKKDLNAYKII